MLQPDNPSLVIIKPEESQHRTTKVFQVHLDTILLTVGLFAIGLDAFIGLQFRGSNPTSKPWFQPNLADAED